MELGSVKSAEGTPFPKKRGRELLQSALYSLHFLRVFRRVLLTAASLKWRRCATVLEQTRSMSETDL